MTAHDLPEPPEGWTISTNVETHIAYYHRASKRSLAIFPAKTAGPTRWKTMGLAGYGPDFPVFSDDVPLDLALQRAEKEMVARNEGKSIDPERSAGRADRDDQEDTADPDVDEGEDDDQSAEAEEPSGQTGLTDFMGGA